MSSATSHRPTAGPAIPMTPAHLAQALEQSQAIDWPYRAEDWAFALKLGRGFVVEADGRLVGTALWWPYGTDYATIGMVIVAAEGQRQGIGARLMNAMLADAAGRTVVLNSTEEGKTLYTRLGFVPFDVVTQHQGVLAEAPPVDPSVPMRAARAEDRATVIALDRAGAGMDRTALVNAVADIADMLVVERDGRISGYGCVRRWGRGVVVGPVVARDGADARALIAALAGRHVGGFVRIDTKDSCDLASWLVAIGLPQVHHVVTMSLGAPPRPEAGATLYTLSNQSLG